MKSKYFILKTTIGETIITEIVLSTSEIEKLENDNLFSNEPVLYLKNPMIIANDLFPYFGQDKDGIVMVKASMICGASKSITPQILSTYKNKLGIVDIITTSDISVADKMANGISKLMEEK